MNKNFSRVTLFLGIVFVLSQSSLNAMNEKIDFSGPTWTQKALYHGANFSYNFAVQTASIIYSVFVQNAASEGYQRLRMYNFKPNYKCKLPKCDERIVFPRDIKELIDQISTWKFPKRFKDASDNEADQARRHILLHGIKGVGKTTYVKQMAAQTEDYYLKIPAAELNDKNTSAILKVIRIYGEKAFKEGKRLFVLFDEVSVWRSRYSKDAKKAIVVDELLTKLLSLPENIICVGTTNNKYVIDDALLDRFKERVTLELPSSVERLKMLHGYLSYFPRRGEVLNNIRELTKKTEGFTGRDISGLVTKAYSITLAAKRTEIEVRDIDVALKRQYLPEKIIEFQREISTNEKYLKEEQFHAHHSRFRKENLLFEKRIEALEDVLKHLPEEFELIVEEDEKGKEKEEFADGDIVPPLERLKKLSKPMTWYKRYLINPLLYTFSPKVLTSSPAMFTYGGLTVGLAAYGMIKTGMFETPQLQLMYN